MLGLKLIHVSKRGHCYIIIVKEAKIAYIMPVMQLVMSGKKLCHLISDHLLKPVKNWCIIGSKICMYRYISVYSFVGHNRYIAQI